ncbi:MAG: mechanosensitive ion channel family protein [Bacteroidia bacterium]
MDETFLNSSFAGNTIENYLWFVGILLAGLVFQKALSKFFAVSIFSLFKKVSGAATSNEFHELVKKPFSLLLMLVVGYFAFNQLEFPWNQPKPDSRWATTLHVLGIGFRIAIIASITWIFLRVVDFFALILSYRASKTESKLDDQLVPFFRDGLKIIVIIFSIFFTLASVFEVNVVTLIGGLGIGGLAVALAAKETLENLLGSFTIFLDKPFTVGDQIKIGNVSGHVESIGLRSTRVRTLEKSIVTVPNKKMVDAELENITDRALWRVRFMIGLNYATDASHLEKILVEIRSLLNSNHMIDENPVVRFEQFGNSSLDVLIVYMVKTNEYETMIVERERINFEIMRIVKANNANFAFPSTSVYIQQDHRNA